MLDFFIVETRCENYYDFTLCAYPIEEGNYRWGEIIFLKKKLN